MELVGWEVIREWVPVPQLVTDPVHLQNLPLKVMVLLTAGMDQAQRWYMVIELDDLLGGVSGGASTQGSGAGGGAISLKASAEIIIEPNVLISANGGDGGADSAGAGGGVPS